MNSVKINTDLENLSGSVILPSSKSLSNRALIIRALCNNQFNTFNLSSSTDTSLLIKLLQSDENILNSGNSGTVLRFITAYLAFRGEEKIIDGSERMRLRPVGALVDALNHLGANISYLNQPGFPPFKINKGKLKGGKVSIDTSISSQFISAILMIAPCLEEELLLEFDAEPVSASYINMTLKLLEYWGIQYSFSNLKVRISPQKYIGRDIFIESDWSSASYLYIIASLFRNVEIELVGLQENSLQRDQIISHFMTGFGIHTTFKNEKILISRSSHEKPSFFSFDFSNNPDLVTGMAVLCLCHRVPFLFYGVKTLRYKESDRLLALKQSFTKFGLEMNISENEISCENYAEMKMCEMVIDSFDDHRITLSFAAAACLNPNIILSDKEVVIKSYPLFWGDLQNLGISVVNMD